MVFQFYNIKGSMKLKWITWSSYLIVIKQQKKLEITMFQVPKRLIPPQFQFIWLFSFWGILKCLKLFHSYAYHFYSTWEFYYLLLPFVWLSYYIFYMFILLPYSVSYRLWYALLRAYQKQLFYFHEARVRLGTQHPLQTPLVRSLGILLLLSFQLFMLLTGLGFFDTMRHDPTYTSD